LRFIGFLLIPLLAAPAFGEETAARMAGAPSSPLPLLSSPAGADPSVLPGEPPAKAPFAPWTDWAEGQDYTRLHRISILFYLGSMQPVTRKGYAIIGSSKDLDRAYSEMYGSGVGGGLETGYLAAPFLGLYFGFFSGQLVGGNETTADIEGTEYRVRLANWPVSLVYLKTRLRFPLFLIGPRLFDFGKSREGVGFTPYFDFSLGVASLGALDAARTPTSGGTVETVRFYDSARNASFTIGAGLEIRWTWGGIALDFRNTIAGSPRSALGRASDATGLEFWCFSLAAGLYF